MLEEYFLVQGREWERFAWLKSRVVAPRSSIQRPCQGAARAGDATLSTGATWTTASSKACANCTARSATKPSAARPGRPERANDVKLSRGGIREIEFIVQLLLVVRGGQFPESAPAPRCAACKRLTARGLMKPETAERLAEA